jgi:hypothetical protein
MTYGRRLSQDMVRRRLAEVDLIGVEKCSVTSQDFFYIVTTVVEECICYGQRR